jgi:hypothetical protein
VDALTAIKPEMGIADVTTDTGLWRKTEGQTDYLRAVMSIAIVAE